MLLACDTQGSSGVAVLLHGPPITRYEVNAQLEFSAEQITNLSSLHPFGCKIQKKSKCLNKFNLRIKGQKKRVRTPMVSSEHREKMM